MRCAIHDSVSTVDCPSYNTGSADGALGTANTAGSSNAIELTTCR